MPEKSTKTSVHYRRGDGDHQCSECSMFRAPHRCTAVTGYIKPVDLCDLFERKQDYADGGSVKAAPFTIPDDVARRLGNGDLATGLSVLHGIFKLQPGEPLGQVDPRQIGNGDVAAGSQNSADPFDSFESVAEIIGFVWHKDGAAGVMTVLTAIDEPVPSEPWLMRPEERARTITRESLEIAADALAEAGLLKAAKLVRETATKRPRETDLPPCAPDGGVNHRDWLLRQRRITNGSRR